MKSLSIKITAVLICFCVPSIASAADVVTVAYQESLGQLQFTYVARSSSTQKPTVNDIEALRFDAFGRRFEVPLRSNHALLGAEQRLALGDRIGIYRGEIAGTPGSWVRLVVEENLPRGILWDGERMWAIEVVDNATTGTAEAVIFRLEDMQIPPGLLNCSQLEAVTNVGEFAKAILAETAALGPGATSQMNMALIGDFEFTSAKGANVDTALITRMNNIDGIFSSQLGVQLNVNRIDTFPANNDPFGDTTDSNELLIELRNYRQTTPAQFANGLTHLFTGRDLDTSTVGVAYTGALCSTAFGAGLTQGTHSLTTDSLIAAHEIGHNFGAPHDGTSGSACESEPQTFIMAPQINGSSVFSSCSITEMQDDVNTAPCITPLSSTDMELVVGSQSGAVLPGNPATFTLEANSVGSMTVNGVVVDVSIPANVSLNSVSATAGSCTSGAGTASCDIGSVAAGTGETISITVSALTSGNADFVGNITAAADTNSNNNQATVRITVGSSGGGGGGGGGGDSGGGGSLQWFTLTLLLLGHLVAVFSRRARSRLSLHVISRLR